MGVWGLECDSPTGGGGSKAGAQEKGVLRRGVYLAYLFYFLSFYVIMYV